MPKTTPSKETFQAARRRTMHLCAWALCGEDLFCGEAPVLTVYTDVPLWCLKPNAAPRDTSSIADLVVCRTQDNAPLFAIVVDTEIPRGWPASLPKIHLRPLESTDPDQNHDFIRKITPTIYAEIAKAADSASASKLSIAPLHEVLPATDRSFLDAVAAAGMVSSGHLTDFGHACGLFWQFLRTEEGPIRLLCTCSNAIPRIQTYLAKGKGVPSAILPLAERLQRYTDGKPIDGIAEAVCRNRLRTMLVTPMETYAGDNWPQLRDLHRDALQYLRLPCKKEDFPYGEILQTISQLRRKYLTSRDPKLWGFSVRMMDLILRSMTAPDVPPKPPANRQEPEDEDIGLDGLDLDDLDLDDLDFNDEDLDPPADAWEKIPLAERLKTVQPPNKIVIRPPCFFSNLPLAMYYAAASCNARTAYPDWLYRTSFRNCSLDYSKARNYTFNSVSNWLLNQRKGNDDFSFARPAITEYTLMEYSILVEPIYPNPLDQDSARRLLQA